MSAETTPIDDRSPYTRLRRNRPFALLWGGQTISTIGDAFFNLAVVWVVYSETHSAFQTSLIQAVWQLSAVFVGPVAGAVADRRNRKHGMVVSNIAAAAVVSAVAIVVVVSGRVPTATVLVSILFLNGVTSFLGPARFSIMAELVERDLFTTAAGVFSTAGQVGSLIGSALAGLVIASLGIAWAIVGDAVSFLIAALAIAVAPLPTRAMLPRADKGQPSFLGEIVDGWRAIKDQPVLRTLVWLGALMNVASFLGPLYPALVRLRLNGDATAFGMLEAVSVIGGMLGGGLGGSLERRFGAGHVVVVGSLVSGFSVLGIAASTSLPLTGALLGTQAFGLTVNGAASGALKQAFTPKGYRGRVAGLSSALGVIAIAPSALVGGWLADLIGPAPLFAIGGVWILGVATLTWANPSIRTARI